MKLRNVPFSPPDMTEAEAAEVRDAILSGWITTGPRTKKLEKEVAAFVGVDKAVSGSTSGANISCMLRSTSASSTGKAGKTEASKPRYRTQIAFSTARYGLIPTLSSCANSQGQSTGCLLT